MDNEIEPDSTAVRVALWRAMHLEFDSPPYLLSDKIGLQLANPADNWQERPDMNPDHTSRFRAAIVSRARFIEDLVINQAEKGLQQYVILGAGLDTFAQRRSDHLSDLQIYEIDKPETQQWKQQRLTALQYDLPESLHFIPVDFETESWWNNLLASEFNPNLPSLVSSIGVSQYITKQATKEVLHNVASLVSGSTLIMTFFLPFDLIDPIDQPLQQFAEKGAKASGTPFISYYTPEEIMDLARQAGFNEVEVISKADLVERYFSRRADDFEPASGEDILVATL